MSTVTGERDTLIMHTVPRYSAPIDRALLLTASATMFEVSAAGVPTPAAITLSALMLGAVGEISFSSEPPVKLTVANGDAVLKFEDMSASIVTVSASTVIDGLTYYARQTLAKQQMLDLRPPPAPAGLAATGHPATISLAWSAVPANYNNLSHTEVWRATVNDFSKAALVGRADGREFTDPVGAGVFRYYWVRYVSRASIPGPYNASSGTVGASDAEVEHMLQMLTGQLAQDQLNTTLGARINLIDGPASTAGSVAARLAAEAQARGTAILSEASSRKEADGALSQRIDFISASDGPLMAVIKEERTARTTADGVLGQRIDTTITRMANAESLMTSETTARINAEGALSGRIDTISSCAGTNAAAIEVEAQTRATQTGQLYAQYTVKQDVNGYVSGYGLATTANNAMPASTFAVRADAFYIANPSGPGVPPSMPFIVRSTETVIDGVTIPIGVYIASAFIQNASITNAKIGGDIWSSNYVAGQTGWRLNRAGNMEVNNLQARGQITGGSITGSNWPTDGGSGYYLGPNGLLLGNR
ncbi:DUF1983 domain-containing protein, partial [Janthinobacterium sp.]|uniref:phage tail tip fiber protein n=1 Tax=Janthinobacterium sp. TaxID=1871054 RepID=UPI002606C219